MSPRRAAGALAALLTGTVPAARSHAEVHGVLGVGPTVLLTGGRGDALRGSAVLELHAPGGLGGGVAVHAAGGGDGKGLAVARLSAQAAASPPRLWLRLHADAGLALSAPAPVVGAGIAVTVRLWRAASLVVEGDAHLIVDGVADTRLLTGLTMLTALAW